MKIQPHELDEILADAKAMWTNLADVAAKVPGATATVAPRRELPQVFGMVFDQAKEAAAQGLTFDALRAANAERLPLFKNRLGGQAHSVPDGSDWNIAEWTNAIAGEVGEACNLAKKIQRGDFGTPGEEAYSTALRELAKELADVVTYADIACQRAGHNLGSVTAEKFNEVSQRVGAEVYL